MTTTHPLQGEIRRLASGALVEIGPRGVAIRLTCPWLVQVASGNPEPDSIEDTYRDIACGAPLSTLTHDPEDGWKCDHGHHHATYGSQLQRAEEQAEAFALEMGADEDTAEREGRAVLMDLLASGYGQS